MAKLRFKPKSPCHHRILLKLFSFKNTSIFYCCLLISKILDLPTFSLYSHIVDVTGSSGGNRKGKSWVLHWHMFNIQPCKGKNPTLIAFVNFLSVNIPIGHHFNLPLWCHWTGVGRISRELVWAGSSKPMHVLFRMLLYFLAFARWSMWFTFFPFDSSFSPSFYCFYFSLVATNHWLSWELNFVSLYSFPWHFLLLSCVFAVPVAQVVPNPCLSSQGHLPVPIIIFYQIPSLLLDAQ